MEDCAGEQEDHLVDVGEEIVRAYLQHIKGCDFTQCNVPTRSTQGEIDVIGIDIANKTVYVCEVAVHLTTGLLYVHPKTGGPDNVERLVRKLEKDVDYARTSFPEHEVVCMFWSPIVKKARAGSKHDQMRDVAEIARRLKSSRGVEVELVVNEAFRRSLSALREHARKQTKALKSPVLRLMQVEEYLSAHLRRMGEGNEGRGRATAASEPRSPDSSRDRPTIVSIVNNALDANPDVGYQEIERLVRAEHPESKFNPQHFSYYKSMWRKKHGAG